MESPGGFSWIDARLRANARRQDSATDLPQYRWSTFAEDRPTDAELHEAQVPQQLVRFLNTLNRKLDLLLALQGQASVLEDYPLQLDVLRISGAGAVFRSQENFQNGDALEIVFTLCDSPLQTAAAVGTVNRISREGHVHFAFSNIRENDLEKVVQFVFQEEREQIRRNKWT
jgi:hypothetical protein